MCNQVRSRSVLPRRNPPQLRLLNRRVFQRASRVLTQLASHLPCLLVSRVVSLLFSPAGSRRNSLPHDLRLNRVQSQQVSLRVNLAQFQLLSRPINRLFSLRRSRVWHHLVNRQVSQVLNRALSLQVGPRCSPLRFPVVSLAFSHRRNQALSLLHSRLRNQLCNQVDNQA